MVMFEGIGGLTDIWNLKEGATILLGEGAVAKVVAPTEDGRWLKVRYLEAPSNPSLERTRALCSAEEIVEVVQP